MKEQKQERSSFKNRGQGHYSHHDHDRDDDHDISCQEGIIPSFVNLFFSLLLFLQSKGKSRG